MAKNIMESNLRRMVSNFESGLPSGKYGEVFLDFAIRRLSEMDGRSKRFVMCALLKDGLRSSDMYSRHLPQLEEEFRKEEARMAQGR
jgi:hypothetical protein